MARVFQIIFALSLFLSLSCLIKGVVARTTLEQNDYLLQNDSLKNGDALLYMHQSCNLILFNGPKQVWATNTSGEAKRSCWAELGVDGNFAVIGDDELLWSSKSGGIDGEYRLILLDSGSIAIFGSCRKTWSPTIEKKAVKVDDLKAIWSPKIGKKAVEVDHDHKEV